MHLEDTGNSGSRKTIIYMGCISTTAVQLNVIDLQAGLSVLALSMTQAGFQQ